jgi:hypothetical protein
MLDKYNSNGYDLYEPFSNQWVIDLKDGNAFHGKLTDVLSYMINKLGFHIDDIEDGLFEMNRSEMNAAHFGCLKSFIFTFNKEITDVA